MPFLAGDIITAQKLNFLSPIIQGAQASALVSPGATNTDVPGCTLTPTTVNANALIRVFWYAVFYGVTTAGTLSTARVLIDGVAPTTFALAGPSAAVDKQQGAASWVTTLTATGVHTIKLQVSTAAGTTMQVYSGLDLEIVETF